MRNIFLILLFNTLILNAQTFIIKNGWSLVGAIENIDSLNSFSGSCVKSMHSYDNAKWNTYPDGNLKKISKGQGFWIYANTSCNVDSSKQTSTFNARAFFIGNCASCHGDNGQGSRFRAIKGNTKSWYSSKLTPFQTGTRTSPSTMSGILKGFDTNNLNELTTFLATLGK